MPPDHSRKSPGHRRSRSRTPHGHRRRDPSVETIRANGEEETNSQYLRRYGRAEPMTVFRNSSGPGLSSDSNPEGNGNSQTKPELLTRIAQFIQENRTLNEENSKVEGEKERLGEENEKLVKENASLRRQLESHRLATEDMASNCASLRNELEEMRQAAANQGPGWSETLGNMIHGTRASKRSGQPEVDELRTKIVQYKDHIQGLKAEIRALDRKTAEQAKQIQTQSAGFAQELDDLRSKTFVKAAKHSDTEIQQKWKTLNFSIRQFVSSHFPAAFDRHTAELLAQQECFSWLPEAAMTLQAPMLCHVVLEAWVWHFLCFRVFDSHSKFWAGEVGRTFSAHCEQLRGIIVDGFHPSASRDAAVAQFHDWRVRSADFISKLASNDEASSVALLAGEMLKPLDLATPTINAQGEVRPQLQQGSLEIVRKASQLAGIFRTSKADFHVFITRIKLPLVHPPSFNFPFDAETMECVKDIPLLGPGGSTPLVDLAVSPGILKAGNSDGAHYDSERILVKLQALCNLQPFLKLLYGDEEKEVSGGGPRSLAQAENGCIKTEDDWAENGDDVVMVKTEPWQ